MLHHCRLICNLWEWQHFVEGLGSDVYAFLESQGQGKFFMRSTTPANSVQKLLLLYNAYPSSAFTLEAAVVPEEFHKVAISAVFYAQTKSGVTAAHWISGAIL